MLGIMLAALALEVVAYAGCVQCGHPDNLMQQQFDPALLRLPIVVLYAGYC